MMTPEIVDQLLTRLQQDSASSGELHRLAQAQGSTWNEAQVKLLLRCLPEVLWEDTLCRMATVNPEQDPVVTALLQLAKENPIPAAALVRQLPRGILATPDSLCKIAEEHPALEVVPPKRIRKR